MPVLRPWRGPQPSHPVTLVPRDPSRHGAAVRVRGWEVVVADPVATLTSLQALAAAAEHVGWDGFTPPGPPFVSGLVGFITDDVSHEFLALPPAEERPAPADLPGLWFGRYTHAICRDPAGEMWLVGEDSEAADQAERLLREALQDMTDDEDPADGDDRAGDRDEEGVRAHHARDPAVAAWSSLTRDQHHAAVQQIKGWIGDGDVYQVNLTMHVAADWRADHRDLARRLFRASSGAAHAAFLNVPGATIASVSPETFLRVDGRRATVRPIKGTRPRSADDNDDRALAVELQASEKDRAEHVMIVDLERNDLGRISQIGSVTVPELMALEAHPTVWHLTSTVEGTLRPEVGVDHLLRALFPCGSVTGAPKRMAVSRISALEPYRRGVYCGAIGVIGAGLIDLSVAIRTAVISGQRAWYGTGGGIVIDSDPDAEWAEAMAKARAFFQATGTLPPGT